MIGSLVWIGALLAVLGMGLLGYCVAVAVRARRAGLTGTAMEARLRKLVAVNLAALGLSAIGLGLVAVGLMLG